MLLADFVRLPESSGERFVVLPNPDNVAVRQAAFFALAINLLMMVAAIVSIMVTIPARKGSEGEFDS